MTYILLIVVACNELQGRDIIIIRENSKKIFAIVINKLYVILPGSPHIKFPHITAILQNTIGNIGTLRNRVIQCCVLSFRSFVVETSVDLFG